MFALYIEKNELYTKIEVKNFELKESDLYETKIYKSEKKESERDIQNMKSIIYDLIIPELLQIPLKLVIL